MQVNINIKKYFSWITFNYAYSFLFGTLGAVFIILIANHFQPQQTHIGTVNVTKMIRQFSQLEAKKNISEDDLKRETKIFGKQLEETLNHFAQQNHLILLPTEAVIAGCIDYTSVIKEIMDKQREHYAA